MKKCPECNSEKIIKEALAIDRGDQYSTNNMIVGIEQNPKAFIFKNRTDSDVRAEVCADCGYISFYAVNPEYLWSAYQMKKKDL